MQSLHMIIEMRKLVIGHGILMIGARAEDVLDYAAFLHDVGYYYKGADGVLGTIANINVMLDDLMLSLRDFSSIGNSTNNWLSLGTGVLFMGISVAKHGMLNSYLYTRNW
jgi:hypothetical protein